MFNLNFPKGIGLPVNVKSNKLKVLLEVNDLCDNETKLRLIIYIKKLLQIKSIQLNKIIFNEWCVDIVAASVYISPLHNSLYTKLDKYVTSEKIISSLVILRQECSLKSFNNVSQNSFKLKCSQLITLQIFQPNGIFNLKRAILRDQISVSQQKLLAICQIINNPVLDGITEDSYFTSIYSQINLYINNESCMDPGNNLYTGLIILSSYKKQKSYIDNWLPRVITTFSSLDDTCDENHLIKALEHINKIFIQNRYDMKLDLLLKTFNMIINFTAKIGKTDFTSLQQITKDYINTSEIPCHKIINTFLNDEDFVSFCQKHYDFNESSDFNDLILIKNKANLLNDIVQAVDNMQVNHKLLDLLVKNICFFLEQVQGYNNRDKYTESIIKLILNLHLYEKLLETKCNYTNLYSLLSIIIKSIKTIYSNDKIDKSLNKIYMSIYGTLLDSLSVLLTKDIADNKSLPFELLELSIDCNNVMPDSLCSKLLCIKNAIQSCPNVTHPIICNIEDFEPKNNIISQDLWKDLSSDIPPIKGGSILLLLKLIKENHISVQDSMKDIVFILINSLYHSDTYVYTAAINALAYFSEKNPKSVIPTLLEKLQIFFNQDKIGTEAVQIDDILKFGELFNKILQQNDMDTDYCLMIYNKSLLILRNTDKVFCNLEILISMVSIIGTFTKNQDLTIIKVDQNFVDLIKTLLTSEELQDIALQNGVIMIIRNIFAKRFITSNSQLIIDDLVFKNLFTLMKSYLEKCSNQAVVEHLILALREIDEQMASHL